MHTTDCLPKARVTLLCLDSKGYVPLRYGLATAGYEVTLRKREDTSILHADVVLVDARVLNRYGFAELVNLLRSPCEPRPGVLILATEPPRDPEEFRRHSDDFDSVIENPESLGEIQVYLEHLLKNLASGQNSSGFLEMLETAEATHALE